MNRIATSLLTTLALALPAILDSALKGIAVLALVALAVPFLHRSSAATRHLVWLTGIVGLLLLPLVSGFLPGWRVLPGWTSAPVPPTETARTYAEPFVTITSSLPLSIPVARPESTQSISADLSAAATTTPAASMTPAPAASADAGVWIGSIWLTLAAVLLLRVAAGAWILRRSARETKAVVDGPLFEAFRQAARQLELRQRVHLFLDKRRIVPLVWGIFRPRLVLPREAHTWDESRLGAVLLHELAHVKRRDLLVMLLTQVACALHWFNPLVWLAAWRLHMERERACDDLVLAAGVKASDYAEHLLHVATKLETPGPVGALAMARPSRLEGRLLAVLNQNSRRGTVTRSIALLAIALSLGVVIPMAMLRAQEPTPLQPSADSAAKEPKPQNDANTPRHDTAERQDQPATPPSSTPKAEASQNTPQQVPILGDIPILGRLFRTDSGKDVLDVKADGTLSFNSTPIAAEVLAKALPDLARAQPDRGITLRADKSVPHAQLKRVLDLCQSAGLKNISVETIAPSEKETGALTSVLERLKKGAPDLVARPDGERELLAELENAIADLQRKFPRPEPAVREKLEIANRELQRLKAVAQDHAVPNDEEPRMIFVKADGTVEVDGKSLSPEQLKALIAPWGRKANVVIWADPNVPFAHVVRVRDACRAAGIQNIAAPVPPTAADHERLPARNVPPANAIEPTSESARFQAELHELAAREAELLASGLGESHPQIRSLRALSDFKRKAKADYEAHRGAAQKNEVARLRLAQAENELARIKHLYEQKAVGRAELDRATAEIEVRKAELARDPSAVARVRLQQAEREFERIAELHKVKLVSAEEFDRARLEVEVRKAELAGDPVAVARLNLQKAEAQLQRVAALRAQNLVGKAEQDALQYEVQIARAQLEQAAATAKAAQTAAKPAPEVTPPPIAPEKSAEILKLYVEDIRLAQEKLNVLKRQEEVGVTTRLPVLEMQAEVIAVQRAKADFEGKREEVYRLYDEEIARLTELHEALSRSQLPDRANRTIDVQRQIISLKRKKLETRGAYFLRPEN